MDKGFNPQAIEQTWYPRWEETGCFKPSGQGQPYTIMLPPPNVTGTLHMGHAFQHTLMDALVRYHRMRGDDTLWQCGTDHAGIATEMVVTRQMAAENLSRDDLGRDGFIERVWRWKAESGSTITRQMRRMGASCDWSRERFTMDAGMSRAVIEAFVRLYDEGLIYRGQRLVNWDPVLQTAISDLEVVSEEEDGQLWSLRYPLADGSGSLVVATTRPETMLGDTAVAVHPDDERYAHLVGRTLRLPLSGREVPIIADAYVDPAFGTGCVKITPAHDFNDYAIGQRHDLPLINIFTPTAHINDHAPEAYRGLDRYEARKRVLADLEACGALVEAKAHKLMVPRGDRSGQVIEPYLTDQWFVRMDALGKRGLELAESGQVRFVPGNWINTYRHWLDGIQDWCISRQLWWGHRIPAWYDDQGGIYIGHDLAEVLSRHPELDNGHGQPKRPLRQDPDVLETWFSSALWSHATLGWPDAETMEQLGFQRYLPSSVLVTGFDIIFFWVARMIMMTEHFTGQIPFRDVYITGLVRDRDGQKMSKSKGNILDPLDLIDGITLDDLVAKRTRGLMQPQMAKRIEQATRKEFPDGIAGFGADALRFTFAALATHGRDIRFDLSRCEGYRNFCNKLWNAARFVLMNTEGYAGPGLDTLPRADSPVERWMLLKLQAASETVARHLGGDAPDYRFDLVAQQLYELVWNDYCDWFVELAKPALQQGGEAAEGVRHTLLYVLERTLRLLHPLLPFITEEIWQAVSARLGGREEGAFLCLQRYPEPAELGELVAGWASDAAEVETLLMRVIGELRRVRSELGISPSARIRLLLEGGDAAQRAGMQRYATLVTSLLRIEAIETAATGAHLPLSAVGVVDTLRLHVPLEGLIDIDAERKRLRKEFDKAEAEVNRAEAKLGNTSFIERAPPEVIEKSRAELAAHRLRRDGLAEQLGRLGA